MSRKRVTFECEATNADEVQAHPLPFTYCLFRFKNGESVRAYDVRIEDVPEPEKVKETTKEMTIQYLNTPYGRIRILCDPNMPPECWGITGEFPAPLRPCPFCKGEGLETWGGTVACENSFCGARMPNREAWNRRA